MSPDNRSRLDTVVRDIESRSSAEKLLVLGMVLAGLGMAYLSLSWDPLRADITLATQQISNVERQIEAQRLSYNEMLESSRQDPNRFANERLARITAEQTQLDRDIAGLAGDLISPTAMTRLLTSLLNQQPGLELLAVRNIAARPLRPDLTPITVEGDMEAENARALTGQVYEHGLRLEFQGDFFSTMKYLRYVEEVSGSFFWDAITFRQLEWPRGHVTLEIHTLSTQEGFIGV
ncbi:MAG: hypothetical protein WDZ76_11090 [Pseudohongiellaceae bacterium]